MCVCVCLCVCMCVSCSNFPIRGMQIYDGPIKVQNCTFRKYVALEGRHTSAFGFRLNNSWQSCPNNNVTDITFDNVPVSVSSNELGREGAKGGRERGRR